MNILHSTILFMLQLSYVCTTNKEDTSAIHFDGGLVSSNEYKDDYYNKYLDLFDYWILDNKGTARMCGNGDMLCAIIIYLGAISVPSIIAVGILIAFIAYVVSSGDNESSPQRSFEESFKQNFFKVGEKFIFSSTNQEKLDALTVTVGEAIEKATKRCL